ncbi:Ctr copper transporter [Chaetomium sp. MPI-CAGE-AT-0009]|nr:Ctr copper transporter [Chaetomium sp. MPI-CAGE-AT-0009]
MDMPPPTTNTTNNTAMPLMGMSTMSMTFFHSPTTPLFWDWWAPQSAAAYAATCVFLVGLAAATRVLLAVRPALGSDAGVLRGVYRAGGRSRRRQEQKQKQQQQLDGGRLLLGGEEKVGVEVDDLGPGTGLEGLEGGGGGGAAAAAVGRRWWGGAALGVRLWRAACEVVLVCLGYFLMIAVMTMNTGYFVSVLGGVFLGMFLLGGRAEGGADTRWHQC